MPLFMVIVNVYAFHFFVVFLLLISTQKVKVLKAGINNMSEEYNISRLNFSILKIPYLSAYSNKNSSRTGGRLV